MPVGRGFSSVFARKRGFEREAARKTIVFRQPQGSGNTPFFFAPAFDFMRGLCYTDSTSKRVYFFVQKIGRAAFRPSLSETDLRRKDLERSSFLREAKQSDYTGGAEHEGKSDLGLHGVQTAQLQHDEKQAEYT